MRLCSVTYVSKLCYADFAEFGDGLVSRFGLNEELAERHLFASKHRPHFRRGFSSSLVESNISKRIQLSKKKINQAEDYFHGLPSKPFKPFCFSVFTSRFTDDSQLNEQLKTSTLIAQLTCTTENSEESFLISSLNLSQKITRQVDFGERHA